MNSLSNNQDLQTIELHVRHFRNLLKSAGEVKVSQLIPSHTVMNSILHVKAGDEAIDTAVLIYSLLRLPSCMSHVKRVILGQSFTVFKKNEFAHIDGWQQVEAPGRRRKMYFDGKDTLAVYIGSVSDVDDLVTLVTAFQIEWNKLHAAFTAQKVESINDLLTAEDITRLQTVMGDHYKAFLQRITKYEMNFTIQLLSGSYVEYMRATQYWWNHIVDTHENLEIDKRPIYFISSNMHSITNLITQVAVDEKTAIINYLAKSTQKELYREWQAIESGQSPATEEFFLNYVAKKYAKAHPEFTKKKEAAEKRLGITTIPAHHYLDINVQIIELKKLAQSSLHSAINSNPKKLSKSDAIIINIDYPLGWAAYQILTEVAQNVDTIRGVYIMGKAAILSGEIGDIIIPTTVFDLHTKNAYVFNNCITPNDFSNIFRTGSIFGHQKSLTVKGTLLENKGFVNHWYKEGYGAIEMEAGPYLNALYECVYYNRYLENEFVNLTNTPFDVGFAHYASDTPYSKAKNLGARNLSYEGVESTYSISLVILKKILEKEVELLGLSS